MSLSNRNELQAAIDEYPGEIIPLPEPWLNEVFHDVTPEQKEFILAKLGRFFVVGAKTYYQEARADGDTYTLNVADYLTQIAAAFYKSALEVNPEKE